jgi:hypothetical protein
LLDYARFFEDVWFFGGLRRKRGKEAVTLIFIHIEVQTSNGGFELFVFSNQGFNCFAGFGPQICKLFILGRNETF